MGKYSGYIVSIEPSSVIVGDALAVRVKYHMETSSLVEKITGWASQVRISSDDLSPQKNDSPIHYGDSYDGVALFNFGAMPAHHELLTVELRGYDAGFSFYGEVVDVKTKYVTAIASPNPIPPPPIPIPIPVPVPVPVPKPIPTPKPGDGALPSWLLPVGIGLVAVVLLTPSGKGKRK